MNETKLGGVSGVAPSLGVYAPPVEAHENRRLPAVQKGGHGNRTDEGVTSLTVPVWPDAGRMLGIGRNSVYAAVARGEVPAIRVGRRLLVPRKALEKLANGEG